MEFSACGARLGKEQNREPMLGSQLVFLHLGNVSSVHYRIQERKVLSAVQGHCSLLQIVSVSLLKDGDRHSLGMCVQAVWETHIITGTARVQTAGKNNSDA